MAKDDYFVVAYQLLKYLYDCLKKDKKPDSGSLNAEFFGITEGYWRYILKNLSEERYISGVIIKPLLNGVSIRTDRIEITPKGILYLEENSAFQKIRGAVKDIADILPI